MSMNMIFPKSWDKAILAATGIAALLLIGVLYAPLILAQSQTGGPSSSAFEVATIKPSGSDAAGSFIGRGPGGGISIKNMTLKEMIQFAWDVPPFQVSGGPSWIDSDRYDVVAKPEARSSLNEMRPMLQPLLADRFQLRVHRETKDLPIYGLVLARKNGKLGPDLVETQEGSCVKRDPSQPPKPGVRYCGQVFVSPGALTMIAQPISALPPVLSRTLGRKVVDQTGLKGNYDISLQFTHDDAPPPSPDAPPVRLDLAGIFFSTFPERLGLKFESQKGPVEVIVIENAEKPSEN